LFGVLILVANFLGQVLPIVAYMLFEGMSITKTSFDTVAALAITDSFLVFLSAMGGMLVAVPLTFWFAKRKKGAYLKEYFALNGFGFKTLGLWIGILFLVQIGTGFLLQALGANETPSFMMNLEYPTLMAKILLLVAVIVAAPVVEEVIFRGFLLKGFSNSFMGVHGAVLLTSALWAVVQRQYEVAYLLVIFIIGVVFAYARIYTNSLYIPMILHGMMNFFAIMGLFYEKGVFNS